MKYIISILSFFFSAICFSQDDKITIDKKDNHDIIETEKIEKQKDSTKTVPYAIIENVPVYSGCNENLTNQELKTCFSEKVKKHVAKKFNTNLASNLGLPSGKVRIITMFKIDTEGNVIDIRVRAPHPKLAEETKRVIKLIPKLTKPGYQRGKPVIVPFSMPIVFEVVGDKKLTRKEKRALRKEAKRLLKQRTNQK